MSTTWGSPYKTAVGLPSPLLSSPTTRVPGQVLSSMTSAISPTEAGERQRSEVRSPKIGPETHTHGRAASRARAVAIARSRTVGVGRVRASVRGEVRRDGGRA